MKTLSLNLVVSSRGLQLKSSSFDPLVVLLLGGFPPVDLPGGGSSLGVRFLPTFLDLLKRNCTRGPGSGRRRRLICIIGLRVVGGVGGASQGPA